MILVTFMLDDGKKVVSRVVEVAAATTDSTFMGSLRGITYSLLTQGATILRIEVNCLGELTWTTVAEVLAG